jgi:hypothetical protein
MSGQSAPPNGPTTPPNDFTLALFRSWEDCNFEDLDNYFAGRASISAREIGLDEAFSQDERILMLMRLLYHLKGAPGLLTFTETLIDRAQRYSACEEVWQARRQAKIARDYSRYTATRPGLFWHISSVIYWTSIAQARAAVSSWDANGNLAARQRSYQESILELVERIERAPYATMLDLVEENGHV